LILSGALLVTIDVAVLMLAANSAKSAATAPASIFAGLLKTFMAYAIPMGVVAKVDWKWKEAVSIMLGGSASASGDAPPMLGSWACVMQFGEGMDLLDRTFSLLGPTAIASAALFLYGTIMALMHSPIIPYVDESVVGNISDVFCRNMLLVYQLVIYVLFPKAFCFLTMAFPCTIVNGKSHMSYQMEAPCVYGKAQIYAGIAIIIMICLSVHLFMLMRRVRVPLCDVLHNIHEQHLKDQESQGGRDDFIGEMMNMVEDAVQEEERKNEVEIKREKVLQKLEPVKKKEHPPPYVGDHVRLAENCKKKRKKIVDGERLVVVKRADDEVKLERYQDGVDIGWLDVKSLIMLDKPINVGDLVVLDDHYTFQIHTSGLKSGQTCEVIKHSKLKGYKLKRCKDEQLFSYLQEEELKVAERRPEYGNEKQEHLKNSDPEAAKLQALADAGMEEYYLWAFMAKGYEAEYWYWDWLVYIRKVLSRMAIAYAPASVDLASQVPFLLTVLFIAGTAHFYFRPYILDSSDQFEALALALSILALILASFVQVEQHSENTDHDFFVTLSTLFVIIGNGIFILLFFWLSGHAFYQEKIGPMIKELKEKRAEAKVEEPEITVEDTEAKLTPRSSQAIKSSVADEAEIGQVSVALNPMMSGVLDPDKGMEDITWLDTRRSSTAQYAPANSTSTSDERKDPKTDASDDWGEAGECAWAQQGRDDFQKPNLSVAHAEEDSKVLSLAERPDVDVYLSGPQDRKADDAVFVVSL